jgi:hypothetical protein
MSTSRRRDKPVTEGFLAGGASLIVTILWMLYSSFHAMAIFALFLISLFCLSLSTLWLLSKEKTIKEWFKSQPLHYLIVVLIELALFAVFFLTLFSHR